jgi:hypothetical protein
MIPSETEPRVLNMGRSIRRNFALTAAIVLVGSISALSGGGKRAINPISADREVRNRQSVASGPQESSVATFRTSGQSTQSGSTGGGISQTGADEPVPYFSVTWTAISNGFSDVTDADGRRTVVNRKVVISGSTIVRVFPDETQDSFSPDITVTDDYDRVETTPCVNTGGVDRNHIRRSIVDPHRYEGTSPTVGHIFPPQQRMDGSWYLFDPFVSFYSGRFFTYRNETEHFGCDGGTDFDTFDAEAGFYADTAVPGDLNGDLQGVVFRKQTSFDSPFSNDPPMHVAWTVVARKLAGDDLTVERLEVTQGLQAADNGIPLVNGRRTVVRAYLGIGGRPGPVPSVSGILRGFVGSTPLGSTLPFNPAREINAPASPNWKNIDDTLNFELPFPWTFQPALRLEVEVNHERLVFEDDYTNNTLEEDVTTFICQPVNLGYLPIHYDPPQGFTPSDPTQRIHVAQAFLKKVYPVADGDLSYAMETGMTFRADVTNAQGLGGTTLLHVLARRLLMTSLPRPDRLVGWLPAGASSDAVGLANMPGTSAWVLDRVDTHRSTLAHEVAHNYGRNHTELTTGGRHWFDVYERKIKPAVVGPDLYDVMNPGRTEEQRWISSATFNFLFGKTCSGGTAQTFEARAATVGDNLVLSGIVNNAIPATGSLDPLYRTSTAPTHIPDPPSAGPGYCVKLKDAGGALLTQYCFDVFFVADSETLTTRTSAGYTLVVPYPAGLARVELTRGLNTLLDFRTPSANAPSVTLTFPNAPGLTLSGLQNVTWNASDPDGDSLTYSLLYSADNGSTWKGLESGLTPTSYPLDFSQLPGGAAARIRVLASDGFHTAQDDSDNAFAVGNKGPAVAIVSPPTGETFNASLPVTLQGDGSDLEDGALGNAALSWSSSVDGALGTGQLLEKLLSVGSHVITLTGTDSDGQTATASVALTISGTPPPAPGFYTVTPCRVADTRDVDGPWGGPALTAGTPRTFAVGGRCGVPSGAKAVSFNFTVTQPALFGHITVYPGGSNPPLVSAMNFRAGQTRANNAIVALGPGGVLTVVSGQPSGTTHFIIDVNGYFE